LNGFVSSTIATVWTAVNSEREFYWCGSTFVREPQVETFPSEQCNIHV